MSSTLHALSLTRLSYCPHSTDLTTEAQKGSALAQGHTASNMNWSPDLPSPKPVPNSVSPHTHLDKDVLSRSRVLTANASCLRGPPTARGLCRGTPLAEMLVACVPEGSKHRSRAVFGLGPGSHLKYKENKGILGADCDRASPPPPL